MNRESYALVLSGGGAKGIYHIGVWKALIELGVRIDAVFGNSVGAIVAGFIAQGDFEAAEKAIGKMDLSGIISLPEELVQDGQIKLNRKSLSRLKHLQKSLVKNKGFDTSPLKEFLDRNLDEKKIRKKAMDFGIITFNMSQFKPEEYFIEKIEEGLLRDYILASASFPGFKMTTIKNNSFIDGGVYNNIPYSMAKDRGYRNIIVIDISGIGMQRKMDITGTKTIYIKNSLNMGNVFDFSREFLSGFKQLGYLDTMRVFNQLEGVRYFYHTDDGLYSGLEKLVNENAACTSLIDTLSGRHDADNPSSAELKVRSILPAEFASHKKYVYSLAECAAQSLNIELNREYEFRELVKEIYSQYQAVEKEVGQITAALNQSDISAIVKDIMALAGNTDMEAVAHTPVYKYERLLEEILKTGKKKLSFLTLNGFFPFLNGAKLFFSMLKEFHIEKKIGM